jgi:coenzyme F420-0:L-glutamate ligase
MASSYTVTGLVSGLIQSGDDITARLITALEKSGGDPLQDGDILVLAESMVATAEGRLVPLYTITPSPRACELAGTYGMDPRVVEVVLRESDEVIGGIPGFLLCMKGGTLLPNASVDGSNAPYGCLVPLPADPDASAESIRAEIRNRCSVHVGVIIADSRVHAMRSGCSGVAVGCSGIPSVTGERESTAISGRPFGGKERAVADMIASAAEIVMGEADEGVPFVVVRGLGLPITDTTGVKKVRPSDCLFMRGLRSGIPAGQPRPLRTKVDMHGSKT